MSVDVYAWNIAAPLARSTPIEGSPALCASAMPSGAQEFAYVGGVAVLGGGSTGAVIRLAVPVKLSPSGAYGTTRTVYDAGTAGSSTVSGSLEEAEVATSRPAASRTYRSKSAAESGHLTSMRRL